MTWWRYRFASIVIMFTIILTTFKWLDGDIDSPLKKTFFVLIFTFFAHFTPIWAWWRWPHRPYYFSDLSQIALGFVKQIKPKSVTRDMTLNWNYCCFHFKETLMEIIRELTAQEISIASLEDIVSNLLLRLSVVGVAVELTQWWTFHNLSNQLTWLTCIHVWHHRSVMVKTILIADALCQEIKFAAKFWSHLHYDVLIQLFDCPERKTDRSYTRG